MGRKMLQHDVVTEAKNRMRAIYAAGHRVVVSFSAGKDSGAALEICIIVARELGCLPVDVVMQDEEIAYPGTYEFAERTAQRPEVRFHWLVMNQPMVNVFNRQNPYYWVFDPQLPPEKWVRQPPKWATYRKENDIASMTTKVYFPPPPGKELYAVQGLRVQESRGRLYGIYSSGGYTTAPNRHGVRSARPIYDWKDGDVWKFTADLKLDYNRAYDTLLASGVSRARLRVSPPLMNAAGVSTLSKAAAAWPRWFDKVAERCPGARTAAQFGVRAVTPSRRADETWEAVFKRECIEKAPKWIAERATVAMNQYLSAHRKHSSQPFPEVTPCYTCTGGAGSWRKLAMALYCGDPFSTRISGLPYAEPELFRPGAGKWI